MSGAYYEFVQHINRREHATPLVSCATSVVGEIKVATVASYNTSVSVLHEVNTRLLTSPLVFHQKY